MEDQLSKIRVEKNHYKVTFFPAVRPVDAGEFPTIGARGCFSSHLSVLNDAQKNGYQKILLLEDDVDFSTDFLLKIEPVIEKLKAKNWAIFYGGYLNELTVIDMEPLSFSEGVMGGHFMAFQQPAISGLTEYLTLMIGRKGGDPLGGPMHVDGAYSWYRQQNPSLITLVSANQLGHQRSSRTDIHQNKWYDCAPIISSLVAFVRRYKNKLKQ
jgi:GR25 family glycosyltransferase involved in LPS biosynthesis